MHANTGGPSQESVHHQERLQGFSMASQDSPGAIDKEAGSRLACAKGLKNINRETPVQLTKEQELMPKRALRRRSQVNFTVWWEAYTSRCLA